LFITVIFALELTGEILVVKKHILAVHRTHTSAEAIFLFNLPTENIGNLDRNSSSSDHIVILLIGKTMTSCSYRAS